MAAPLITTYSPHIFSISNTTTITITGTGWNLPGKTVWFQLRDNSNSATALDKDHSFIATSKSDTSATVVIPMGKVNATATKFKLFWGVSNTSQDLPSGTGAWYSNVNIPFVYIFDVNFGGDTVPVQGGTNTVVHLFNLPDDITAKVILTPRTVRSTSWTNPGTTPAPITVGASLQITNTSTREGLIHFRTPVIPFEGQYSIDVSLVLPTTSDDDSGNTPATPSTDPADISPPASVPGPGLIGYVPILGSLNDVTTPSVPTMAISCAFSATNPAPTSKLSQGLPNNKDLASWPSWLDDSTQHPTKAGAGDVFEFTSDDDGNGNYKLFIIDGVGHYVLDENSFSLQLMDLNGGGQFINGTPVAVRVWVQGKGWRCARMQVDGQTYSSVGHFPRRWVIDADSKEYPTKPEELFGIYQLVSNPSYKPGDDKANQLSRASPCLIETQAPNMINIGIDKVIIVPGAFSYPIDPYFVSPSIPPVYLIPSARPPQSFVYGVGGYSDGFSVNSSVYSVYFIGYITYVAPTDAIAGTTAGPSPNATEAVSATCIGSSSLLSTTDSQKYLLIVASEPSVAARPANLFYTIYKQGQTPPRWKPLMSNTLARAVSKGSGQVSIVQIPKSNAVLFFQRSKPEVVDVYVCNVDFSSNTLTLSDTDGLLTKGVLTLKSATVMDSVIAVFKARFGITDLTDVGIVYDSWFSVLYQADGGLLGSPGYHIFTSPQGFTSSVIHLWYPATTTAPFIDESRGTCLGVYGTMKKSFPPPLATIIPPTTSNPLLQIVTGNLGSEVDLLIDSVNYGGRDAIYVEVKAINSGNGLKFGIREWSTFGNGSFLTSDTYTISATPQDVMLKTKQEDGTQLDCKLKLHWAGTRAAAIDASQVIDGDIWIFEVLPFSVNAVTSGVQNTGAGTLVVDTSGSHLPFDAGFCCSFSVVYTAPPDKNSYGTMTVINSQNTGSNTNTNINGLIVPNGTTVLDQNYQAILSPNTANIKITIGDKPQTQDQWFIAITKGIASNPVSGTVNNGDWGYPTVTGTYSGPAIQLSVSCTKVSKDKIEFIYTITSLNDAGQKGSQLVADQAFSLLPITKKNSANVDQLIGWTTTTFQNGLIFGFDNISGVPAVRDMWTFIVQPSTPVIETMGQRPVATFTKAGSTDTAWVVAPTKSAGGRFLQFQVPLRPPPQGAFNLPSHSTSSYSALLPLRSTLEPFLSTDATGPVLYFKGLKTPGVSWSNAIKAEVLTDSTNEKIYGLSSFLGLDYRPAHSGIIYIARFQDGGLNDANDNGVTPFSTLSDNDLITEPKMAPQYLKELPPPIWKEDPLSKEPPQYKPTGWFAVFPQYRFHIGQVHVISNFATLFGSNADAVSSALQEPTMGAAGRQVLDETFFINTMVPVNNPDVFQQYQNAVMTNMSDEPKKSWLQDSDGNAKNPFDNSDFYNNVEYNPGWQAESDYPKIAKYIMQLSLLRQTWDSPPAWSISTSEGRTVPAYWRFRIGGPTCDLYLNEAYTSSSYQNKYNSLKRASLPTYFSTDPIFVTKFGSAAAASAYVLTDVRLETSFAQMPTRSKAKLIDALTQGVAPGGMYLVRNVSQYLAGRALLSEFTPIPHNQTVDVPVTVSSSDNDNPPASWEIKLQSYAGPLMFVSQMGQGLTDIWASSVEENINLEDIFQSMKDAIAANRSPGVAGDRPNLEARSSSRNIIVGESEVAQPIGEIVEQSAAVRNAELMLPADLKANLASLRKASKIKFAGSAFDFAMGASLIANTVGAWNTNTDQGRIGDAKNAFNVITDVIAVGQFGVNIGERIIRSKITKRLEATSLDMEQQAEELAKSLKPLETISKVLGGLMNVASGIESVLSGAQEVNEGGSQKLDGQLDIASGSLMIAGGAMELAGALGAAAPIPAVGEIIAGIGMEISIIKIWVGGTKSVGALGQSLLSLIGIDGGMTEEDLTINYILHVKNCAVLSKVSRQVVTNPLTSPDPRDGGVEANGSKYIIEPLYSVADQNDLI